MRGAHTAKGRARKRLERRWPRRMLIVANLAVFATLALSAAAYGYVRYQLGRIRHVPVHGLASVGHSAQSHPSGSTIAPFTLLAIGSDSRSFAGGSQFQATSGTLTTGQRSDSIILIRVIPAKKELALLSIPRDTIEEVPGYGRTRVNAAFNAGTPSLLVQVLHQDFGIEVNHVAIANFAAFQQISQAVGGVKVWFPAPARDLMSNLSEPAGCQTLIGPSALAFVRSRHYQYYLDGSWHDQFYPESDLGRIQRQQAFIKLALEKARKVALTNVGEITRLIGAVTSNLTLDSAFSSSELLDLARTFSRANLTNIPQFTYPTKNSTSVPGALDPLVPQGEQVIQKWLNGGQPVSTPAAPPTPTPPSASTPTTVVAPASIDVEVANGSGAPGQASQAASDLRALGYRTGVAAYGYTPSQSSNLILYAPDAYPAARQLQAELQHGAKLQEDSALTPTPYSLELVTGAGYSGVAGGSSSNAPTTTTTTTLPAPIAGASTVEAASSSYANGQYIPPGRVPGQKVVTCH